jgi:DHA1 family tetracycline resistance protein-like MFS transporter
VKARAFILVTIMLDMLAFGIVVPVFQPLILSFEHGNFAAASLISGAFGTIFAFVQFFAAPVLGTLSDRFGRRPLILLSNLGTSLDYAILALAPNVGWLFVGRVLAGATTASITIASAYITDVTPEEKRAGAFGMIGGAFGVGFIVGPAIGGLLAAHDLRLPFWVAGALSLANFLYGLFVLPESLGREHRNPFSWQRANPLGAIRMLRRHHELSGLSIVSVIEQIAHESLPQIFVIYTIFAYGWTLRTIGISMAVVGVTTILVSTFLTQRVVDWFGERRAIAIGLCFGGIGFWLFSGNQTLFWIGIVVNMLEMVGGSASQAIMSRRVGKHEQGELQGAISFLRTIGMMIGPVLFSSLFAFSSSRVHAGVPAGLPFMVSAALCFAAVAIAWYVTSPRDDVREPVDTRVRDPYDEAAV